VVKSAPLQLLSDQVDEREVAIVLRELSSIENIHGDVVEFGCYVGTTSVHIARELMGVARQFYVYDSFEGLPPKAVQDESPAGTQFVAGALAASKKEFIANLKRANVPLPRIKKAWFNRLSPEDIPERVAFAFLDGDYYDSILYPLQLLTPKLVAGAKIVIDDYANEALPGAAKAVNEWLARYPNAKIRVEHSMAIISWDSQKASVRQ